MTPKTYTPYGLAPYTLGIQRSYDYNALVYPFPSFEANQDSPVAIFSAIDAAFDKCENLWILDQGVRRFFDPKPPYPPGLFKYSFKEKRIVYFYRFPKHLFLYGPTLVVRLIIDDKDGCDNLRILISDPFAECLLVFDKRREVSWKICHSSMRHQVEHFQFHYRNKTVEVPAGIYSIAITPHIADANIRFLLYSSYSGITTYAVPLSILYNENIWSKQTCPSRKSYHKLWGSNDPHDSKLKDIDSYFFKIGSNPSHKARYCDIDKESKLYFCINPKFGTIDVWNITKDFKTTKVIVQNKEKLADGCLLKVVKSEKGNSEIVVSTSPIDVRFLRFKLIRIQFFL